MSVYELDKDTSPCYINYTNPNHGDNMKIFVEWSSGGMCGYTTAHELRDIQRWRKNLHKKT